MNRGRVRGPRTAGSSTRDTFPPHSSEPVRPPSGDPAHPPEQQRQQESRGRSRRAQRCISSTHPPITPAPARPVWPAPPREAAPGPGPPFQPFGNRLKSLFRRLFRPVLGLRASPRTPSKKIQSQSDCVSVCVALRAAAAALLTSAKTTASWPKHGGSASGVRVLKIRARLFLLRP